MRPPSIRPACRQDRGSAKSPSCHPRKTESGRLVLRNSLLAYPCEELIEKRHCHVDLFVRNVKRRREGDNFLEVAADIEHEAIFLAFVFEMAFEASSTILSTSAFDGVKLSCGS